MTPESAADLPLNRRRFTPEDLRAPAGESAAARALFAWYSPGFSDRLGDRLNLFDNTDGPPLELLRLRAEFSRVADFEFSLRARAAELRDFEHASFARVCRVDRLPEPGGGLALVSVRSDGVRLSDILRLAAERGARLSAGLLLPLAADAADALAALQGRGPQVAHGALGADRLVIAPGGRLLVAEYVLGSALRGLPHSRARLWQHLRLALPADPAVRPFTPASDVFQLGLAALAMALSRPIDGDDDLERLENLVDEAARAVPGGGWDGRWSRFEAWLRRSLRLEGLPYPGAREAAADLGRLVPPAVRHARAARGGWDQFVAGCEAPPILTGRGDGGRPALGVPAASLDAPAPSLDAWDGTPVAPAPAEASLVDPVASALPSAPPNDLEPPETVAPSRPRRWQVPDPAGRTTSRPSATLLLAAVLALATLGGGVVIGAWFFAAPRQDRRAGSIQIDSNPRGALVAVNGAPAGRTPVTLALAPGAHVIELVSGSSRRSIPVTLAGGARLSHFVEMPPPPPVGGATLQVTTEPAGLRVLVDGTPRGTSPVVVADLEAGSHVVTVEGRGRRARQAVEVASGTTATLFVPLPGAPPPAAGWLTVAADVELQVHEAGELLGTSRARIMLPAGRHELDLVNEELGVRISDEVQVAPGGTAVLEAVLPRGRLDVNALPWAEVWLDGQRLGETPLGGVAVRVGRHTLTFRHPQLGERREPCVVSAGRATRVGVDLRR